MTQDVMSAKSIICDLKEIAKKAKVRSFQISLNINDGNYR